jgi:hypothetical protein
MHHNIFRWGSHASWESAQKVDHRVLIRAVSRHLHILSFASEERLPHQPSEFLGVLNFFQESKIPASAVGVDMVAVDRCQKEPFLNLGPTVNNCVAANFTLDSPYPFQHFVELFSTLFCVFRYFIEVLCHDREGFNVRIVFVEVFV